MCVAYDMTGGQPYLAACKRWSDRMIEYQNGMIPRGAYYMQYGRKPGEEKGDWYVADCSSIALGVLATSIRCTDQAEKRKYRDSVQAFGSLVADNFVRPSGGITDGYWPKSDDEWWCSTGIYGSLAFCLYDETADPRYLKIGLGAIDWLNRQDLLAPVDFFPPKEIQPTVIMYCLEAYSAGLPHLEPGTQRLAASLAQLAKTSGWMKENLGGRAGIDYVGQWGSKFGGLPFHLYVSARHTAPSDELVRMADAELRFMAGILRKAPPSRQRDQLALFAMMSYAEKLAPGGIYRVSKQSPPRPPPEPAKPHAAWAPNARCGSTALVAARSPYGFFQELAISSRVRPLVSGISSNPNKNDRRHTPVNSQNAPPREPT
jgi:hypothetical protein